MSSTVGFFSFFPPILSAPPFIFIFLNRLKNTRRRRRVFGVKSTQPAELSYHSLFALKPVALLFVVFFSCVSDGNSSLLLLSFFFHSWWLDGGHRTRSIQKKVSHKITTAWHFGFKLRNRVEDNAALPNFCPDRNTTALSFSMAVKRRLFSICTSTSFWVGALFYVNCPQ